MAHMNTKFFHLQTIIRRRKNRLVKVQKDNGEWANGKDSVGEVAADFF